MTLWTLKHSSQTPNLITFYYEVYIHTRYKVVAKWATKLQANAQRTAAWCCLGLTS